MIDALHEHDCDNCRFVGADQVRHINERGTNQVDMYVCDTPRDVTLIRRYGPREHYSSVPLACLRDGISEKWSAVIAAWLEHAQA